MYKIEVTNKYKKDLKKHIKHTYNMNVLEEVEDILVNEKVLPAKYKIPIQIKELEFLTL